jgi:hypothetical protein
VSCNVSGRLPARDESGRHFGAARSARAAHRTPLGLLRATTPFCLAADPGIRIFLGDCPAAERAETSIYLPGTSIAALSEANVSNAVSMYSSLRTPILYEEGANRLSGSARLCPETRYRMSSVWVLCRRLAGGNSDSARMPVRLGLRRYGIERGKATRNGTRSQMEQGWRAVANPLRHQEKEGLAWRMHGWQAAKRRHRKSERMICRYVLEAARSPSRTGTGSSRRQIQRIGSIPTRGGGS